MVKKQKGTTYVGRILISCAGETKKVQEKDLKICPLQRD